MATIIKMVFLAGSALAARPGIESILKNRQATNVANNALTLAPINGIPSHEGDPLMAQTKVTLPYGHNDKSFVNITLTMPSSIILETIDSLTAVDCSADSVTVSFSSPDSLNAAFASWSAHKDLVLITNHLGDCDTEFERGFFVAGSFAIADSKLVATAQKTTVADVASHLRASFAGLPGHSNTGLPSKTRRGDIISDPKAVSYSNKWSLPPYMTLYQYAPYFKATANSGSVALTVTLDGYLDYNQANSTLEVLYVDATTTLAADMELGLDITAPYSNTFSYSNKVEYYIVDVPGIMTFGPDLGFTVGADVSANAAMNMVVDFGTQITQGTFHLDFVGNETSATNWTPTYSSKLTLGEQGTAGVTPFVAVTVGLDFSILGGVLNLSGGLTPKLAFPVSATMDASQLVTGGTGKNVTVTQVDASGVCSNGVEVLSDFGFTLDAFLTQFWKKTLYSVAVPIADQCYTWT